MKQLIITADDFGYSKFTNNAIIKCFQKGIVTSTSLIVNTKYFDKSVELLEQNKALDVGVHINLTEFKPSTRNKTLIDKNGNFIDKNKWFNEYYKKADIDEIENKIEAQILKAISSGLNIMHINGHNHIHIFPNIVDVVIKLAKKYKIMFVRLPYEKIINKRNFKNHQIIKRDLIADLSISAKNKIIKNRLKTTDAFYGILNMDNMDFEKLSQIFTSMKDGTSELMVHPAYADKKGDKFHRSKQREKEIGLLKSSNVKELMKKFSINLTSFGTLKY